MDKPDDVFKNVLSREGGIEKIVCATLAILIFPFLLAWKILNLSIESFQVFYRVVVKIYGKALDKGQWWNDGKIRRNCGMMENRKLAKKAYGLFWDTLSINIRRPFIIHEWESIPNEQKEAWIAVVKMIKKEKANV